MSVVSGANGFLGSYVVMALLKKGVSVKAFRRKGADMSEFNYIAGIELSDNIALLEKITWLEVDINDILTLDELFQSDDIVYHCAAKVSFNGSQDELMKANAEGTANMVNACLRAKVKKMVFVSSTAAIGRSDETSVITENNQWNDDENNTEYAISKHFAELEVWRGIEEGLNAVIVNPAIILGPGNWTKGSCKLFSNIKNGFKFYTNGVNGFVGVNDVANAMLFLGDSDIASKRFLLVSENWTYKQLFFKIAEELKLKKPSIEIKISHIKWIKWLIWLKCFFNPKSSVTIETMNTSVKVHPYSNDAMRQTGFQFTPLNKVIEKTCKIYNEKA